MDIGSNMTESIAEDFFHLGVKAILINSSNQLLILKSNRKNSYWDLPGGRMIKGESEMQTLHREVAEETGITKLEKITRFEIILSDIRIPIQNGSVGLLFSTFLCRCDVTEVSLSEEHCSYKWHSPAKAASLLRNSYPESFLNKMASLPLDSHADLPST